ncbi:hypothetical protein PV04_08339 [Phialophora macrospora]|uniref:C2H2-type domain-containing protein n=1 Tax=Phialophora macrospora TaxID=1851006 RepID=A0A0D2DVH8_9EURO|nr:hypothetical protein PV04_08339 [Phialophora macrospora]
MSDGLPDHLSWDEPDILDIKDALECGIFDGSSISEAGVAERLLDQLQILIPMSPWRHEPPSSSTSGKALFSSVEQDGRALAQPFVEELVIRHQETAAVQRRPDPGPGEGNSMPDAVGIVTTTNISSEMTADNVTRTNLDGEQGGINGEAVMALTQQKEQRDGDHQEETDIIHHVSPAGLEVMQRLRQDNAELQQKVCEMMARIEDLEKRQNTQHSPIPAPTPCSSEKPCLGGEEGSHTDLANTAKQMDDIKIESVKGEVDSMSSTPAQSRKGQLNGLLDESMHLDEKIHGGGQFELEINAFLKEQALQSSDNGPPLSPELIFQWFRVWLRSFRFPRSSSSLPVKRLEELLDLKEKKAETRYDEGSNSQERFRTPSVGIGRKIHLKLEAEVDNRISEVQQNISVKVESEGTSPSPVESDDAFMESSGEESFILDEECVPVLDADRRDHVERVASELGQELAREFLATSADRRTTCTQQTSRESSGGFSTGRCSRAAAESSTAPTSVTKPSSRRRRLSDEDDEEDARKQKQPHLEKVGGDEVTPDGLLACPYAKHDPVRYSEANQILSEKPYRRCRTVYLTNISRLKQHLYRVHRRPEYYCPSCYMDFATEDECEIHSRSRLCVLRDCPFEEKMTSGQCKAVKRRKMGETPVNAWFGIFEILFPGAERPNNPYVECGNFQAALPTAHNYAAFLENRLPLRLSERLGGPLYGSDDPMTQWLINMALERTLPTVLHELHGEFQMFNPEDNSGTGPD